MKDELRVTIKEIASKLSYTSIPTYEIHMHNNKSVRIGSIKDNGATIKSVHLYDEDDKDSIYLKKESRDKEHGEAIRFIQITSRKLSKDKLDDEIIEAIKNRYGISIEDIKEAIKYEYRGTFSTDKNGNDKVNLDYRKALKGIHDQLTTVSEGLIKRMKEIEKDKNIVNTQLFKVSYGQQES